MTAVLPPITTMTGQSDAVELWNIGEEAPSWAGSQGIFNILGRLREPDAVEALTYRLNGAPPRPVHFRRCEPCCQRLARAGDFNIDTIRREALKPENSLVLTVHRRDGSQVTYVQRFHAIVPPTDPDRFRLTLEGVSRAQEAGQMVDGQWRAGRGENGERCLEIRREDAGLDRIILFGSGALRSGYTIRARLSVREWLGTPHNVGLLFKWVPHRQGDGTHLPSQWSTGLGYYYSHCPGLRIRVGVDVHRAPNGEKIGDHVLGEAALSHWHNWARRIGQTFLGADRMMPQIVPGQEYIFELSIERDEHRLTVWPVRHPRPGPQVIVHNPPELIESGAAGIIAHRCAVQVFEFEITPSGDA